MKITFTPGQRVQTNGTADFFRLLSTVGPITVEFYYQGREIAERVDVEAGYAEQFRTVQFDRVDITSATVQTVQWETALGSEIRYDRGAATISGAVDLNAATLTALESVDLNANTINELNRPLVGNGFFSDNAVLTANTPLTVFTPGANVNGAVILSAYISWVDSANSPSQVFICKSSAPVNTIDGAVVLSSKLEVSGAGQYSGNGTITYPQYVNPGQGLYFISGLNVQAGGLNNRYCRYRLL